MIPRHDFVTGLGERAALVTKELALARTPILIAGLAALVVLITAGYMLTRSTSRTPEGDPLLTAVPNAGSFEPREMPKAPVLANTSQQDLAIAFGYKVAGTSYSYALTLRFPTDGDQGTATLTARHAGKSARVETPAVRFWDAPRDAYAVATQSAFDIDPAVPTLCLKAVIGPGRTSYDLSHASLCVAQRDGTGACHPETLACGQVRARS